ncbi:MULTISPECIES: hypothetical protein [unclassified Pseudoalteromonas]|uniref:hypothetical protein n=1 Tax=unclassified Pseudoalteromonas TaxID=194690 RepID=UPI001F1D4AD9|nr:MULTISPECIES: hypothetical protein [unclassified Pseudoalteromonas]MCF2826803.1 hypothetical protein [Pseudoalteromonas sp. OF5H-5]MCF2833636.1 hypothetical protein [Pseudoalteromonas sp. DL2-H6]MCF2926671.1 hypothetical protein [Pseudoalteromonas sp. DL2-H1]
MLTLVEQQLLSFGEHIVLAYVFCWLLYLFAYRRADSNSVTLTYLVLFSLLMSYITPYLYTYAVNNVGVVSKAVFHLAFCAIQILAMCVIRINHNYFRLKMSKMTLAVIYLYASQVFIHLIRLLEKVVFGTSELALFYTHAINTVNVMLLIVCVLCIVLPRVISSTNEEYL